MISRLLRLFLRLLARISRVPWSKAASTPFVQVAQRCCFILKLLKAHLISNVCSELLWRDYSAGKGSPSRDSHPGGRQGVPGSCGRDAKSSTDVISFSLHPFPFVNRVSTPPGAAETSRPSVDAKSVHSGVDATSIMFQLPQSPDSANSGGEIHVVGPDSPRNSTTDWHNQHNEPSDETRLEAPLRSSVRPASLQSTHRSVSPASRSSFILRHTSSNASFRRHAPSNLASSRPQTPSLLHAPSRPQTPSLLHVPSRPHSLHPSLSRVSVRSYSSIRPERPPSIITPEPEPLPIIEPTELPEPFEDPDERIWTMTPQLLYRYDKKYFVTRGGDDTILAPMTMRFEAPWSPAGWKPIIHPEGQLYFWHEEKRIITEAYLYDRKVFKHVLKHLEKIESFIARARLNDILGKYDLVLDLTPHGVSGYYCGYYLVNHEERSIFWLQSYPASELGDWKPAEGHKSKLHLKHAIEAQYWYHCQMFPTTFTLKMELVAELHDILLYSIVDTLTSVTSTAAYSHDELNKMLGWVNSLKKNLDIASLGSGCLIARLMYVFARERFLHFYGEPAVRLARGVSVYGTIHRRSILMRILSPMLFSAPLQHLMALEKIWVDEIVHDPTWKVLIGKFNKQWEEFILFATVMLNANMALLAIQSVDTAVTAPSRSPTQIASYLSVVASIGSIIIGLLLIKMNRVRLTETAPDAVRFIEGHQSKILGLETLAILYSLPFALLMWGMVAFLVAFCFICFQNTTPSVRGIIATACILTGFLVAWCIRVGWDKSIHLQPQAIEPTLVISEDEDDSEDGDEKYDAVEQVNIASDLTNNGATDCGFRVDHSTHNHQEVRSPDLDDGTGPGRISSLISKLSNRWKESWSGLLNLELRSKLPRNFRPSQDSEMTTVAV